jgi:hypothetical protein
MIMATDLKTNQEPSVTKLVSGIVSDAEELFKQQFELLKHEVHEDIRKTKEVGLTFGLGAGLALVGAILLVQMLVYLTEWLVPQLPLWASYGIWGALTFAGGAILFWVGKTTLEHFNPLPQKTAEALKENVQWLTNQNANPNPK